MHGLQCSSEGASVSACGGRGRMGVRIHEFHIRMY